MTPTGLFCLVFEMRPFRFHTAMHTRYCSNNYLAPVTADELVFSVAVLLTFVILLLYNHVC